MRDARAATGVPGVAAGLLRDGETVFAADGVLELGRDEPVLAETPFRIASITKPFTATLCAACRRRSTSGSGAAEPHRRPALRVGGAAAAEAAGLWSYSNAGYWEAARVAAAWAPFDAAMREHVLEPLGLEATGFDGAGGAGARAHPGGRVGASRGRRRRVSGGAVAVGRALVDRRRPAALRARTTSTARRRRCTSRASRRSARGTRSAGGCASTRTAATTLDHEGSIAGYQSLLLLVPERVARARRADEQLARQRARPPRRRVARAVAASRRGAGRGDATIVAGRYELDGAEASVERAGDGLVVTEAETDPVTGTRRSLRYPARPIGDGVYGFARGTLMSHRLDFPRAGHRSHRLGRAAPRRAMSVTPESRPGIPRRRPRAPRSSPTAAAPPTQRLRRRSHRASRRR